MWVVLTALLCESHEIASFAKSGDSNDRVIVGEPSNEAPNVGFVMATLIVLAIFIGSGSSISTQSCQIGIQTSQTN